MSPRNLATAFLRKLEEEARQPSIATQIFEARLEAGLTQQKLAKLVGSQQSVIARLEDPDYEGHSLAMLRRVAKALGSRLVVELRPASKRDKPPAKKAPRGHVPAQRESRTKKANRPSIR